MERVSISGAPVTPWMMNQWIVACKTSGEAAVFDGGAPSLEEWKTFERWAEAQNFRVSKVLQTHAHPDHVAGLGLLEEVFPEATIHLHSDDLVNYREAEESCNDIGFPLPKKLPDEASLLDLKGLKTISVGTLNFEILHTPGHAPGHVCFYERELKLMIGGDVVFRNAIGRTDLPYSSPEDMRATLKMLVDEVDPETTILPGHGEVTTMAVELANNSLLTNSN